MSGKKKRLERKSLRYYAKTIDTMQKTIDAGIPGVFSDLPIDIKTSMNMQMQMINDCGNGLVAETNMLASVEIHNQIISDEIDRLFPDDAAGQLREFLWVLLLEKNYQAYLYRQAGLAALADKIMSDYRNHIMPPELFRKIK